MVRKKLICSECNKLDVSGGGGIKSVVINIDQFVNITPHDISLKLHSLFVKFFIKIS